MTTNYNVTLDDLRRALTQWDIDYRANPRAFQTEVEHIQGTAEDYGDGASKTMLRYLEKTREATV